MKISEIAANGILVLPKDFIEHVMNRVIRPLGPLSPLCPKKETIGHNATIKLSPWKKTSVNAYSYNSCTGSSAG